MINLDWFLNPSSNEILTILRNISDKWMCFISTFIFNLQISNKNPTDCEIRYFKANFNRFLQKLISISTNHTWQFDRCFHSDFTMAWERCDIPLNAFLFWFVNSFAFWRSEFRFLGIRRKRNQDRNIISNTFGFEIGSDFYNELYFVRCPVQ